MPMSHQNWQAVDVSKKKHTKYKTSKIQQVTSACTVCREGRPSLLDGLVTHTHCTGVVNTPGFEFKWAIQPHWSLLILDHWIHVRFESARLQIPSWCAPGAERYLVCPMKVEAWEEENKANSIEQLSVILTLKTWGANVCNEFLQWWRELSTCNYWAAQHVPGKDCNRLLSEEARLLGEKRCLSSTFRNRAVNGLLDFSFSVEENMWMLHVVLTPRFEDAGMLHEFWGWVGSRHLLLASDQTDWLKSLLCYFRWRSGCGWWFTCCAARLSNKHQNACI